MKPRDVKRLFKHWSKFPPVRVLVAAAIGFEPPPDEEENKKRYMTAEDMKRMMDMTGGKIPGLD